MTTPLTRSFVSVTYLLGVRGKELSERIPDAVARLEVGLVRGLSSEDRSERTRFLAASVRDLTSELRERALQPLESPGDEP
jgi:hypothetical protein